MDEFSMGDPQVKSRCKIERVQPSGKVSRRLEVVSGDAQTDVAAMVDFTFSEFKRLDTEIDTYEATRG